MGKMRVGATSPTRKVRNFLGEGGVCFRRILHKRVKSVLPPPSHHQEIILQFFYFPLTIEKFFDIIII